MIEFIAKLAGYLGFNSVRVRWKLMRWRDSLKSRRHKTVDTISHVGYAHRVCTNCGRIQDRAAKLCANCGHKMEPRFIEILNRIGFVTPHFISVTSLLIVAIIVCFAQSVWGPDAFTHVMNVGIDALVKHGANYWPFTLNGEWWRLATSIFLHGGFFHILFNLVALEQVGPEIERIFGRGRYLFLFMLTGILASATSIFWHHYMTHSYAVSIGASGAIMGLVGVAAAWGHKDGTSIGRSIRDMMLKWAAYTFVFGFFIDADNAAHVGGFLSGAAMGLVLKPKTARSNALVSWVVTFVAIGAVAITVFLVLFPPQSTKLSELFGL